MLKTAGPALAPEQLMPLDAVLLSHHAHSDNLDTAGRALLNSVPAVFTTPAAARRLGPVAREMAPWASSELIAADRSTLRITATPARHGPPASLPFVGPVTGFLLTWSGQRHGALYISGDTVRYRAMERIGKRVRISAALLHLGGSRFAISGRVRYTMIARDVPPLVRALGARIVLPVHYEGWRHFRESPERAEQLLRRTRLDAELVWIKPGETVTVPV